MHFLMRCSSAFTRYLNNKKIKNWLKVKMRTKKNKSGTHESGANYSAVLGNIIQFLIKHQNYEVFLLTVLLLGQIRARSSLIGSKKILFCFLLSAHWKYSKSKKLMWHTLKWMNKIFLKDLTEQNIKILTSWRYLHH